MRTLSVLILLAALVTFCAAQHSSSGKNRKENAFSKIVPRLLWNIKRGDQESHRNSQQPIIIVQQPSSNQESDRHHHHNPNYPYYPYYPPPPPPQSRPPPPFPGMDWNTVGGGPTYLIINPNNMQGIYLPSSSNSSNSTSSRRSAFVPTISDLLQGLNLDDLADGSLFEDDSEVVNAAEEGNAEVPLPDGPITQVDDDRDEDVISEDEIDALDRQSNRGLSPKHLVSILMQDKRRRRIQEVLAGIYLRNYNLNRK
ncbi:uncharacterized protein LOC6527115 [Drosophila yakuba]|uniref:Uncharacterized protein n=1 Tax=Drosophila yakuba TaxID=7245 RepID=B4P0M5_DROYA|nr:uncharacterized protein LOC6527115 [Drosophila yakuba]EDW87920.1 uncharacterized protein Dyak_GE18455 [Drosophila yakuba]